MAEAQAQSLRSYHTQMPQDFLLGRPVSISNKGIVDIYAEEVSAPLKHDTPSSRQWEYSLIFRMFLTTAVSATLLASDHQGWVLPLSAPQYQIIIDNRASVQIAVQLLSNVLSLCQVTSICTIINLATRLRFSRREASMDDLQFWSHLCTPSMSWKLPLPYLAALSMYIAFTLVPSAVWAGALSPISVSTSHVSIVMVPSYKNASLIKEYPSEIESSIASTQTRNSKGLFTYRVGITMEGALLSAAASATTVDGTPRRHVKLDDTGLTYIGRSYGVGSPAGLTDTNITSDTLATSYLYQESGYSANVKCIYNSSTNFFLSPDPAGNLWIYSANGQLPNSNGFPEQSTYFGHTNKSVVAIGVASTRTNGTQYIGIAAGSDYGALNTTQCSIDYIPTMFNVSINIGGKNITVLPVGPGEDISPSGNISHATTRQMELISNDQTNLYQSLLGNSFMASVADYNVSQSNSTIPTSEAIATLAGLTNSVAAMIDDMLVGYASAQLMVGNQSRETEAVVTKSALKIGQRIYIQAMFVLNLVILLLVVGEAGRTRFWRGLGEWDYMKLKGVIVSSLKGGSIIEADARGRGNIPVESKDGGIDHVSGQTRLRLESNTQALVLESSKHYDKEDAGTF